MRARASAGTRGARGQPARQTRRRRLGQTEHGGAVAGEVGQHDATVGGAREQQGERRGDDGGADPTLGRPAGDEHGDLHDRQRSRRRRERRDGLSSGGRRARGTSEGDRTVRRLADGGSRVAEQKSSHAVDGGRALGRSRATGRVAVVEAAFFDLDKTVIAKASMVAFSGPLHRAGHADAPHARSGPPGASSSTRSSGRRRRSWPSCATRCCASPIGWDQAEIGEIVRETLVDVVEPIVYDEALELIREHRAAGRKVFLVSASPEEIVAPLAQYLGVDEAIATRAELDEQGRYTGRTERYCYGPAKVVAIAEVAERDGIDLAASYAYSDSATDVPCCEAVGHPVAVNPDRELLRAAKRDDWEVRRFTNRVPLRERVPMPAPRQAALGGGAVLAAVGAGVAARWLWDKTTAPAPATAPTRRGDEGGGRAPVQALRTFFVARVASAAITTSSSSFFMAAMVAGDHRVFAARCDARRLVAASLRGGATACRSGAVRRCCQRRSSVGPHALVTLAPSARPPAGRGAGHRPSHAPDPAVRRGHRCGGRAGGPGDRAGHRRRPARHPGRPARCGCRRWPRRSAWWSPPPACAGWRAARRPRPATSTSAAFHDQGDEPVSLRPVFGRIAGQHRHHRLRRGARPRGAVDLRRVGHRLDRCSAASPASSPARTPSCCWWRARRRAWPPSSRRRPTGALFAIEVPYRADVARRNVLPAMVAAASSYVTFAAVDGTTPILPVDRVSSFGWARSAAPSWSAWSAGSAPGCSAPRCGPSGRRSVAATPLVDAAGRGRRHAGRAGVAVRRGGRRAAVARSRLRRDPVGDRSGQRLLAGACSCSSCGWWR